jgi:MoaA/NifB/PqqE/SkfB family radical SAM enzyme
VSSIWNSERARAIRQSILDDSFRHCTACPFLETVSGCVRYVDEVEDPNERSILRSGTVASESPEVVNLAYDRTCNLSCPSCRTELVVARGSHLEALERMQRRLLDGDLLARIECLYVTGSGDPFASRLYRDLLRSIDPARYPRLRVRLHTNGLLFTPETWSDLGPVRARVQEVEVSVDAACASTYAINRRGGDWQTLLANLDFIATLRRDGPIENLQLSFVVQANNWREMPAFVELGGQFGADRIFFSALRNWNTFFDHEFSQRAVHLRDHPEHAAFVLSLADERLRRPQVTLGELVAAY